MIEEQTLRGWEQGPRGETPQLGKKEQTLRGCEQGSGGETPRYGMRVSLLS
jgi:hypothetical protein